MGNSLCHFELFSADPAKAQAFYERVFAWRYERAPEQENYTMIYAGTGPTGGLMPMPANCPAPRTMVYFAVDNIDDTLVKAEQAGGKVVMPRMPIPGVGAIAVLADPEGIRIGIYEDE